VRCTRAHAPIATCLASTATAEIDSKVKAALTREYNKRPHKAQTLGASSGVVASMRGGKRSTAAAGLGNEDGDEEEVLVADEDLKHLEEDDEEEDAADTPLTEKGAWRACSTVG